MHRLLLVSLIFLSFNLSAQMDSTSYSVGMVVAQNLKQQGLTDLDQASFNAAVADVLSGAETKISLADANANFQQYVQKSREMASQKVKIEGEEFLKKNGERPEVTTTASGLQYEVLVPSTNPQKPGPTDKVKVHYHGTLIDGTVFDSSVDRGEPISFPLNGVIKGWTEGLQLMSVGSKHRLFIPYDLAYGTNGAGGAIKPYQALIFDVSLLAIE